MMSYFCVVQSSRALSATAAIALPAAAAAARMRRPRTAVRTLFGSVRRSINTPEEFVVSDPRTCQQMQMFELLATR
jgi:hypothetical protein